MPKHPKRPKRTAAELAVERALARGVYDSMTNAMGHPPTPRGRYAGLVTFAGWLFLAALVTAVLAVACSR